MYWYQIKMMNPFHPTWKRWKENQDKRYNHVKSYWELSRREGCLTAGEVFQVNNFWARVIPEPIIYKIFQIWGFSKIGYWINVNLKRK